MDGPPRSRHRALTLWPGADVGRRLGEDRPLARAQLDAVVAGFGVLGVVAVVLRVRVRRRAAGVARVRRHHQKIATTARAAPAVGVGLGEAGRSEAHTSELQSLMRNSYASFCWK